MSTFLWVIFPYVCLAVFVVGHVWRYRYDKFGWTTRSSQLYEDRLLRIGSPLFHFGMLGVVLGHVMGLIVPQSVTDAVGLSRSAYRRPLKGDTVADPDRALRQWLRAWAKDHPRYGYRRAYHDARAEGWVVNHKKIQRLWRDEGLRVPQRRRRKRVGSSTVDAPTADAPNVVWAVDFQFDADEHGRPIKICSIVDEHTRECIGGLVERSITADRLTAHLEDLVAARGAPAVLRSDNGPEFISEAMADWAGTRTGLSYIPPGSPWRNGYVESFNSRIRDECLNINSFYSLLHAQVIIGDWKDEYNHHRRHSSLGYLTPAEYARQCTHQMETDDSQNVRTE